MQQFFQCLTQCAESLRETSCFQNLLLFSYEGLLILSFIMVRGPEYLPRCRFLLQGQRYQVVEQFFSSGINFTILFLEKD